ncbi:carbohydrate ABC transporter permease [Comamonadaceae bacterium G21597-S1]|nr:carbohydrate ABC transporter permease [Comamonadaceae bacterium G21597-S1]
MSSRTPRQRRLRQQARQWARVCIALLITAVFVFPVYWLFMTAFKTPSEIFSSPPTWIPSSLTWDNFAGMTEGDDLRSIINSLVIATVSTVVAMVLGSIAAYSLARHRVGGDGLSIWIMSLRMVPPMAMAFPLFLMFATVGLIDTYPGLIVLYVAVNLPYVIWVMRGFIEDIAPELEQSALIDGCTRWQALIHVVFPMARAGMMATAVFAFVYAFNEFAFAVVMTRSEVITFPVQITHHFSPMSAFWARIGAMSILGCLPVFVMVVAMNRYLVRGLSGGALKG